MATAKGPFYKALGTRLAQARQKEKYTQAALARIVGLTRTSITNIEKGRQPVQVDLLARLAEVLRVDVAALIPERSKPEEPTVVSKLQHLSAPARDWVTRVIGTYTEEEEDGTAKLHGKKEGQGTTGGRKRKARANPD